MVNAIDSSDPTSATSSAPLERMRAMRDDVLSQVASKMGETPDDLKKDLASGKSLTELAAAKGLSKDDLQSTIEAAVKKDMPNASADQVANITNRMAQAHGHHHGHHAHAQPPAPATSTDPTDQVSIFA